MAYSTDYKKCAVEYKRNKHTFEETKEIFRMSRSTYYEWEKEYDAGFPEKQKRTCKKKIDKNVLQQMVMERPDSELAELAEPFNCTPQAIFYALKRMKITLKKRHSHTLRNQKKHEQPTARN
jgi:transposase